MCVLAAGGWGRMGKGRGIEQHHRLTQTPSHRQSVSVEPWERHRAAGSCHRVTPCRTSGWDASLTPGWNGRGDNGASLLLLLFLLLLLLFASSRPEAELGSQPPPGGDMGNPVAGVALTLWFFVEVRAAGSLGPVCASCDGWKVMRSEAVRLEVIALYPEMRLGIVSPAPPCAKLNYNSTQFNLPSISAQMSHIRRDEFGSYSHKWLLLWNSACVRSTETHRTSMKS